MPTHGGDQLARGAPKADFGMTGIDEKKWIEAFGEDSLKKIKELSEKEQEELVEQAKQQVEQEIAKQEAEKLKDPTVLPIPFRAIQDRIVISRIKIEEKVGSFYVPDESKEKPAQGIVVAVGPGKYVDGDLQRPSVTVGDHVYFGKFAGQELKVGFENYLILREEDLFIALEKTPTPAQGESSYVDATATQGI